jgi:ferredoxin
MKLNVDAALCQAYGLCAEEAPTLVDLDDFGYSAPVGDGTVPAEQQAAAHSAVAICPAKALRLLA